MVWRLGALRKFGLCLSVLGLFSMEQSAHGGRASRELGGGDFARHQLGKISRFVKAN